MAPERRRRPEARSRLTAAGRRLRRLTPGEAIAALAAILLFVFMFLDWYDYEQGGNLLVLVNLFGFPADAWQILDVVPWLLLVAILAALGMALPRIAGWKWEPAVPPSAAVAVLGGLATLLILYRIVVPPDAPEIREIPIRITVELGAYLSLAAAIGIACGGYRAMGERGTSFATVADGLASRRRRSRKNAPKRPPRPEPRASRKRSQSSSG